MDTTWVASACGLVAAISWGLTDFLIGKSSKTINAAKGAVLVNTYGAVLYVAYYVIYVALLHGRTYFPVGAVMYAVAGSVFMSLAHILFFKAMQLGPVGLVSPISSMYPIVTLLCGFILFGVHVSALQIVGMLLVIYGVLLATGITGDKTPKRASNRGPLLALAPVLGWGIAWALISKSIIAMGWEDALLIELMTTPAILLLLSPLVKGRRAYPDKTSSSGWLLPSLWGAAVTQMIGFLAVNIGIKIIPGNTAIVVVLSACYPVLTIFLALRHLHEKLPFVPLYGGVVGVVGIIVLSLDKKSSAASFYAVCILLVVLGSSGYLLTRHRPTQMSRLGSRPPGVDTVSDE